MFKNYMALASMASLAAVAIWLISSRREKKLRYLDASDLSVLENSVEPVLLTSDDVKRLQLKKRTVAMLVSFIGSNYHGFTKTPGYITVEEILERAIFEAGGLSQENFGELHKSKWSRSARTDKGVHAAGQIVSAKVYVNVPNLMQRINARLPEDIRVTGIQQLSLNFCARYFCDERRYEYLFALEPLLSGMSEILSMEDVCEQLNSICSKFNGFKRYHNFSTRIKASDNQAVRHIMHFRVNEVLTIHNHNFLKFEIAGTSFVKYQIRKMVGMVVAIFRKVVPLEALDIAFQTSPCNVPMAPAAGLLLDHCRFNRYNKRENREKVNLTPFEEARLEFKKNRIYPVVADKQRFDHVFTLWVDNLMSFSFDRDILMADDVAETKVPKYVVQKEVQYLFTEKEPVDEDEEDEDFSKAQRQKHAEMKAERKQKELERETHNKDRVTVSAIADNLFNATGMINPRDSLAETFVFVPERTGPRPGFSASGTILCRRCNQEGHTAKSCSQQKKFKKKDRSTQLCFNCNQPGHSHKLCPSAKNPSSSLGRPGW
eukprot:GILK01008230.1.p1 GENE.GILK01008230.1~~GILK01008230.1.p1  ORF type:complete len:545 (+),score=93.38 GILK01008230.1:94-1728(+)